MEKWIDLFSTQKEAAEALGVTPRSLRLFLKGRKPRKDTLLAMRYIYECKKNDVNPKLWPYKK